METNVVVESELVEESFELTTAEKAELKRLEGVIKQNTEGVFQWGLALMAIRGKRLYRANYTTFDDYVRDKWDMGRAYADRLIGAGQIWERLTPIGVKLPGHEAQVRPMMKIAPAMQPKVWEEAVKSAPDGRVTAKLVGRIVGRIVGPAPKKDKGKPRPAAAASLLDAWNERISWMIDQGERAKKEGWDEEVRANAPSALRYILTLFEG